MIKQFTSTAKSGRRRGLLPLLGVLAAAGGVSAGVVFATPPPPPAPTISAQPASLTTQASASFTFTDSKSVTTFQCSLDGASFVNCGSSRPSTRSYTGLAAGSHTFQVTAIGATGTSSPTSYSWTIDPTPPTLSGSSIVRASTSPTNASTLRWTVTFSKPVINVLAGDFGLAHSNTGGSVPTITGVTPSSGPSAIYTLTASASGTTGADNGSIGLNLTSKGSIADQASNALAGSTPFVGQAYNFDTATPPAPVINSGPPTLTNHVSATFVFSDSEPGTTLFCRLDVAAYTACTSPLTYSGLGNTEQHSFQVLARDALGNQSASASWSWTVDTAPPPTPTITAGPARPPAGSQSTSARFTFAETGTGGDGDGDADDGGQVSFLCGLDGFALQACTSATSYSSLSEGTHIFRVEALDGAGNISAPASLTWIVDTVAPTVSFTQTPPTTTTSGATTFAWTGSDGTSGSGIAAYFCRLDSGSTKQCTSPDKFTVANGQHSFAVYAVDNAGNTSAPILYTWTVGPQTQQPYTISGTVTSTLYPGAIPQPINLSFSNPNAGNGGSGANGVQVSNLAVSTQSVTGPNITVAHPCTSADFATVQFSGAYPFYVPQGTSSLSSLGFAASTWPTLQLLDRPVNQDGCEGATVTLHYAGTP